MSRFLHLHPHVGYGLVGSRPVFLDLKRDRYFALDRACEAAFHQLREADGAVRSNQPGMQRLLSTGLFASSTVRGPLEPAKVTVPSRSALDRPPPGRPGVGAALRAHLVSRRARRGLRREPLLTIVERERERRAGGRVPHGGDPEDLARRFRAARALAPAEPVCLPDSLALLEWLARHSAFPTLVFGVRLDPFGAHCWVQTDEAILNDAADRVAEFAPVLVIK